MTLTIDNLPPALDAALQARARQEGRSVAEVAAAAIAKGLGVPATHREGHDLNRFRGTWVDDPEFDEVLKHFEQIDEDRW